MAVLRQLVQRTKAAWWDLAWRLKVRQRVTRLGIAFAVTMVLVGVAAFISANNLLFLILAAMMAVFLTSGFISRLGLAGLELDLKLPQHIAARRTVRAGVRLRNGKKWMPSFSILLSGSRKWSDVAGAEPDGGRLLTDLYFPVIAGGATIEESAELRFARRGVHKERSFEVSTRFPFGFAERREEITIRHEVLVYPCLDPKPELEDVMLSIGDELELAKRGQGLDFYRIRPYELLESSRHVDWKATAHTGALQVREYAQEQQIGVHVCLDLNVEEADTEWFEWAVEAAAVLCHDLSMASRRVRLVSQTFDVTTPDAEDIYTILKYLSVVSPMPGKLLAAPNEHESYQVVFTKNPGQARAAGWCMAELGPGGHILGPDDLLARRGTIGGAK